MFSSKVNVMAVFLGHFAGIHPHRSGESSAVVVVSPFVDLFLFKLHLLQK